MEVLAKGQLSYMILSCLSEKDMYGLELIEQIKLRYGREIKLPSLYSNLNRMKELKYISSYLKDSTKGPKCSYSSITENGRSALEQLRHDFGGLHVVPKTNERPEITPAKEINAFEETVKSTAKPVEISKSDDYGEFFAISDEEEKETPVIQPQPQENRVQDDNAQVYNQKIYAAAKDFSRNKNKRSYSENQIELSLSTAPAKTSEQTEQNLSELKTALIKSREGQYDEILHDFNEQKFEKFAPAIEKKQEEKKDDGKFITDRLPDEAVPKPKKIEPPRLNVILSTFDKKLPAPKRNVAVDPTCSDVRAKLESLYAKAELKKEPLVESEFEDYDDLKEYYNSQEVEFKIYERPEKRPKHNTNLLKFFVSLVVLGMVGVGSGLFYLIFSLTGLTSASTNFVYYLFPIFAAVYAIACFYNYKTSSSKVPKPLWHPAIVWTIFALLIVLVFLINYACGVPFDQAKSYFSTILVPIYAFACGTVVLYYSQIFALKRFWK